MSIRILFQVEEAKHLINAAPQEYNWLHDSIGMVFKKRMSCTVVLEMSSKFDVVFVFYVIRKGINSGTFFLVEMSRKIIYGPFPGALVA